MFVVDTYVLMEHPNGPRLHRYIALFAIVRAVRIRNEKNALVC